MRPLQKWAVFNLTVLSSGLLLYLTLYFLLGSVLAGRIAGPLMGSLGLGALFVRRKKKQFRDERDRDIENNASLTGLWIFFLYYVAAGIYIMFRSREEPISANTFEAFWWCGALLLIVVMSGMVLILYGWGKEMRSGALDFVHSLTDLQKGAALSFLAVSAILAVFLFLFPAHPEGVVDWAQSVAYLLIAVVIFFSASAGMSTGENEENEEKAISLARRVKWLTLAAAFLTGYLATVAFYPGEGIGGFSSARSLLVGYCAFGAGTLAFLAMVIFKARGR